MTSRMPLILSAAALAISIFGSTPIGNATKTLLRAPATKEQPHANATTAGLVPFFSVYTDGRGGAIAVCPRGNIAIGGGGIAFPTRAPLTQDGPLGLLPTAPARKPKTCPGWLRLGRRDNRQESDGPDSGNLDA